MPLVARIAIQLSHERYRGEYDPDSFFENAISPPLATPFKNAINAANGVKFSSENEKTA